MLCARCVRVLGVDSRQRDERASVARPRHHLRQPGEWDRAGEHRTTTDPLRQHRQRVEGRPPVAARLPQRRGGIELEFHQPPHAIEGVGEDPLDPLPRAVKVDEHREVAAAGLGKQHRRPAGAEQPPLDLGDLKMGIDGVIDDEELPPGRGACGLSVIPQGVDAGLE